MSNQFSAILGATRKSMSSVHNETGISRTTLHRLYHEKTENPDTKTVNAICKCLNITPNQFYGIDPYIKEGK